MDAIAPGPEPNRSSVVARLMLRRRSVRRNWQARAVDSLGWAGLRAGGRHWSGGTPLPERRVAMNDELAERVVRRAIAALASSYATAPARATSAKEML